MLRLQSNWLPRCLGPALFAVLLAAGLPAVAQRASASSSPGRSEAAVPPLTGMGPTSYLPNPVASFRYARRFVRPGETLSAAITLSPVCAEIRCFVGTSWTVAGAPANACRPTALTCAWKVARAPSSQWTIATMPITTTSGVVSSADVYAVLAPGQLVLDGTIADGAGNPFYPATIAISGARSGMVAVDSSGYFSVFLPRGRYTVAVDAGSAAAERWFSPPATQVTLTDRTTANFRAFNHVVVTTSTRAVTASGTGAFTATIQLLNPLGQKIAYRPVHVDTGGPDSLVCAVGPATGLVEPQDFQNGKPLYLPVTLTTDANGTVSLQVFAGTIAGTWHLSAADGAVALPSGPSPSFGSTAVALLPGNWHAHLPVRWKATVYTKGHGKAAMLSLPLLIYDAAHGLTTRDGSSAIAGAGDLRTVLRWMQTYLPLSGYVLAPLSADGVSASGVLISTKNGRETRVLDTTLLNSMIDTPVPLYLPKDLPTLAAWQAAQGIVAIRTFPGSPPESGLTYNGFPYLPSSTDLFNSFENSCLQKAQGD